MNKWKIIKFIYVFVLKFGFKIDQISETSITINGGSFSPYKIDLSPRKPKFNSVYLGDGHEF